MKAWDKFNKNIVQNGLVRPFDRVLLCVSGGPDSVCMAHLFWRLRKTLNIELFLVYCDHGLRRASAKEARFITALADKLDIHAEVVKIPVRGYSQSNKASLETAGRVLRYEAFVKAAGENRCNLISTGHNANDNAETALMWLIRGTGSDGMSGIPLARPVENKKAKIIRPILCLTRSEIMEYLKSQKLRYCTDESNASLDFTRNRLRHEVIPALEKYNPCFVEHVYALSRIFAQENDFLNSLTRKAKNTVVSIKKDKFELDLKRFFRYNKALRLRLIKSILPEKKSQLHIERIHEWISGGGAGRLEFSSHWELSKNASKVVLKKHK
jgi:tRNA(Ile)-lysidine synthase